MNQNTEQLWTDPIGRLLFKLSLPAMIGMLVTALYNIIDTIFVARGIGATAVAAIGIAFPIQMILMAVSSAVGLGGASISSRKLGKGDDAGAAVTFLNVLVLVGVFAAFAVSSAFFMLDDILKVFGATSAIMELSRQYLSVVLISSPFFMFTLAASAMVRAEGQAPYQMKVMLTTVVVELGDDAVVHLHVRVGHIRGGLVDGARSSRRVGAHAPFLFRKKSPHRSRFPVAEVSITVRRIEGDYGDWFVFVHHDGVAVDFVRRGQRHARDVWGDRGTCHLRDHQQIHGARRHADYGHRPRHAADRRLQFRGQTIRSDAGNDLDGDAGRDCDCRHHLVDAPIDPGTVDAHVHDRRQLDRRRCDGDSCSIRRLVPPECANACQRHLSITREGQGGDVLVAVASDALYDSARLHLAELPRRVRRLARVPDCRRDDVLDGGRHGRVGPQALIPTIGR